MLLGNYNRLNCAVNEYFFDGKYQHRPIYLDLEGEAAADVSASIGVDEKDLDDYVGSVVSETLRLDHSNPYIQQIDWLRRWHDAGRLVPPPFTALLCAFSIAAERMKSDENFSANNYYARLFELFDVSGATAEQKFRQHAKSTRQFWRSLNIWLSEHDYDLGRPTARPVNSWPYASYGLSQALVRNADRQRFGKLFEAMRLVPGDNISESEMMLYVHEWMASATGPTPWLRKLWNVPDLRERVVAAALEELQSWERQGSQSAIGPGRTRLSWSLGFTGFPSRSAVLALCAHTKGRAEPLEILSVSDPVVAAALAAASSCLGLQETGEESILVLGPSSKIDICRLLLGSTTFLGKASRTEFSLTSKPVIVMARTEAGTGFREVQRAGLFEELAVLCHESWLARIEGHLRACGKPGHVVIRSPDMRGIPQGWLIVRDIELVRSLEKVPNGLQQLNPIGGQAAISAVGGLRLGPGVWHSTDLPRIEATSTKSGSVLEIHKEALGDSEEKLDAVSATGDFMEIGLDGINLKSGANLRAVVKKGPTELAEIGLSFRSAETPRPVGKISICHKASNGLLMPWGATSCNELPSAFLYGTVHGGLDAGVQEPGVPAFQTPGTLPSGSPETEVFEEWQSVPGAEKEAPGTCVVKGYHHLKFDAFEDGDDRYDAKRAVCLICGWETMSRSREEALLNARAMRENAVIPPRKANTRANFQTASDGRDRAVGLETDVLLDGLSYLGRGTWAHFQRLCAPFSEEPWFSLSLASDLEALGHIEIARDLEGHPKEWQVTPPALVQFGTDGAYLAGFQSTSLIELLKRKLSSEAEYRPWRAPNGFLVHRWHGMKAAQLVGVASGIADPHGREVSVPARAAMVVASVVEHLGSIVPRMPPIHVEASDKLARYDVDRACWSRANDVLRPGAYRISHHGTRYVYRAPDEPSRMTSHAVAKVLAARDEGKRLHAYDPAKQVFTSVLGVEPVGLYARALAMSAGKLPRTEAGRQHLEGVEPAVGNLVIKKLYEQG